MRLNEVKSKENLLKSILGREEVKLMEEILLEIFEKDTEELKERANYLDRVSKKMKFNTGERIDLLTSAKAWTLECSELKSLITAYNRSRNKKRRDVDLLIQTLEQECPATKYYKDT